METFLDLCRTRRSVRAFRPDAIPEDVLGYIMECVRLAPSAVNFQPWHFTYITDKAVLAQLAACYDRSWFRQVPACFVVSCRKGEQWIRKSHGASLPFRRRKGARHVLGVQLRRRPVCPPPFPSGRRGTRGACAHRLPRRQAGRKTAQTAQRHFQPHGLTCRHRQPAPWRQETAKLP